MCIRDSLSTPAWSPDGKLIAFVDDEGRIGLVTPSGQRGALFDVDATATSLSWSPDSSRLAFDGYRESESGSRDFVVVLELATGNETLLAGEEQGAQAPEWSPEGDQIAFLSMRLRSHPATTSHCAAEPYETHLWSMRPDGTKAHPLAEAVLFGRPSWGRAGETISLPVPGTPPKPSTSSQPEPTPVAPTPTASSAPTPKPASDPPPVATPKPTSGTAARPAPSSTLGGASGLISVRGEGGIYVVDPKAAKARALPGTNRMWAPAWSPSMKELAVEVAEKGGGSSIYTISADGTHPHLVLENASAPSWSADGTRIFAVRSECSGPCASDEDAADVLYGVSPDGTGAQQVDLEDAEAYYSRELAWPADGRSISFFEDESPSGPGSFDSASATWSPDETELAFTGALGPTEDESENNGLWIVSADGGTPTLLLSDAVGRPSWAR